MFRFVLFQKIGYDNAAAVAKKAHKEGNTLKVRMVAACFVLDLYLCHAVILKLGHSELQENNKTVENLVKNKFLMKPKKSLE